MSNQLVRLVPSTLLLTLGLLPFSAQAQISADGTVGTAVTSTGTLFTITGGTISGSNLFHSFSQFSIPAGRIAFFGNNANTANIFARVTGGSTSNIDGLIRANGTANLFLLNPNGILFGANASLKIGGSFLATTAESILFKDGIEFNANNSQTSPLLSVNIPVGLQFGTNPGDIQATGTGQKIITSQDPRIDPLSIAPLVRTPAPANLEVAPGRTLALIGGNINLQGSALRANNGRVELGGVGSGVVGLQPTPLGWILDYTGVSNFQDITLAARSAIDASGFTSGGIQLAGRQIQLSDSSVVLMQVFGDAPTANLKLTATELIDISGSAPNSLLPSTLGMENLGAGRMGDLIVTASDLVLREGGGIGITHAGSNRGSNVSVEIANSILLSGESPFNPFEYSSFGVTNLGSGDGGDVNVTTRNLTLENGAAIGSITILGTGSGGDVIVNATESIRLRERGTSIDSTINSSTLGAGNAGRIFINTAKLVIEERASIGTSSIASGSAGEIAINASESVKISRSDGLSAITSAVNAGANLQRLKAVLGLPDVPSGNGGTIRIATPHLSVSGLTSISVGNDGTGRAGNLEIQAGSISLNDRAALTAASFSGEGGNIILQVSDLLLLRNGSGISATARGRGTGNGGNLDIEAKFVVGVPGENSDITANAFAGNGGNIQITTQGIFGLKFRPQLTPKSDITASSQFGVNGTVVVNQLIADPSSGLTELATGLTDPSDQVQSGCSASQGGEFIVTGRGGLPPNPNARLQNDRAWSDIRDLSEFRGEGTEVEGQRAESINMQDVEANSWRMNEQGNVELVAVNPQFQPREQSLQCDGKPL
ncbi:filamentous hemagglutinin N-terminal domain-containing protein [Lusitaniella coriacea]|uniref:two-partner secretion domain-containing protein n=1 Tax=Lusitaniella coriacea TaxID=1983105 RepID=UPI003CFAC9BB